MALWKKATSLKDGTLEESHSLFEFTSWSQDVKKMGNLDHEHSKSSQ